MTTTNIPTETPLLPHPEAEATSTEATKSPAPVQKGERYRLLDDADKTRTFVITEVASVGKSGKQFRCTLQDEKTGETLSGIAPSRLAPPYRGPRTFDVAGFVFRPEVEDFDPIDTPTHLHPAMYLAGMLPALLGAELLDLVKEAAEKDTIKAHAAVVRFCVLTVSLPKPTPGPRTFLEKLRFGFGNFPPPDYRPFLTTTIAKIHAAQIPGGE